MLRSLAGLIASRALGRRALLKTCNAVVPLVHAPSASRRWPSDLEQSQIMQRMQRMQQRAKRAMRERGMRHSCFVDAWVMICCVAAHYFTR
ncbi:hypothetical protein ACQR53_08695 [Xanthomonas oryzae]|uniref:hypothetical protein n=1 Tax=Xanthomonas oryzae TaxID=347 RepID=UPI0010352484|nr:hypothetical protein [Xanthomonas oryzae]QBG88430.1 hypothetical protein EYC54_12775 [Xanthomonas oryzae]